MKQDDFVRLGEFLDSFHTLTLATCGPGGPWAASLFFVRDDALNIYFVSSRRSRHVQNLLAEQTVAVTVNGDHDTWTDIRGLQISGRAEIVGDDHKAGVTDLYLRRFTEIREVLSAPSTDSERTIAERFLASDFFRVRPATIRMIDNSRGFGQRIELALDDPAK